MTDVAFTSGESKKSDLGVTLSGPCRASTNGIITTGLVSNSVAEKTIQIDIYIYILQLKKMSDQYMLINTDTIYIYI
jgi:hypothetical protein